MASTTVAPETPVRGPDGGPSAGTLTELAALEAARDEKRHLLDRAAEAAAAELTAKDRLPVGCTADDLPALLQRYYFDIALSGRPTALPSLLAFTTPDHVTYGSDWPYAPAPAVSYFTGQLDAFAALDADERAAIDRVNATRLRRRVSYTRKN